MVDRYHQQNFCALLWVLLRALYLARYLSDKGVWIF